LSGTPRRRRWSAEEKAAVGGLAALAREKLGQDPFCGVVVVFRSKRADRVKLLFWDGTC
jgi:transposase